MNEKLQAAVQAAQDRFGAQTYEFRDEVSLTITPDQISSVARLLRDDFGFKVLCEETAVDFWPQETPRFHVIYRLRNYPENLIIGLRVPVNGNNPTIPTIEEVFCNANWFEREIWDMFGIRFEGHSDLRRILMPYEWQGHPLRKDYPLGYEEVEFTLNFNEIEKRKPYMEE